ncbi:hypothetical protein SZN_31629 [Streptomyces zinciresistens K42]|uniref:Uncharacterized protein n=1 Tax=Streptomyces zinciresistens K42 TaxID=700597 RepID=G2GLE0_9ACTN|nr:hypothetical protein SZN_31629 [Streptomyces zinciresistens K42]
MPPAWVFAVSAPATSRRDRLVAQPDADQRRHLPFPFGEFGQAGAAVGSLERAVNSATSRR